MRKAVLPSWQSEVWSVLRSLVNGRFIKPVDTDVIDRLAKNHDTIITLEENVKRGGYGECVTDYVEKHYPGIRVVNITLPDAYVEHGDVTLLRSVLGIDSDSIMEKIKSELFSDGESSAAKDLE